MGEQWCALTRGMPPAAFPQAQNEPGKAAAVGLLMLMVLQEPLTNSRESEPIPFHSCSLHQDIVI